MQTSKYKLPAYQRMLNGACVAALAILTVTFFVAPQILNGLRIPPHAPQTLGLLLAINCLGLITSVGAARLKFTHDSFRQVVIGSTLFLCFSIAAVDLALAWKVYAEQYWQWSGLLGLAAPGIIISLMGCQLLTEDKISPPEEENESRIEDGILEALYEINEEEEEKLPLIKGTIDFLKLIVSVTFSTLLRIVAFLFPAAAIAAFALSLYATVNASLFHAEQEPSLKTLLGFIAKFSFETFWNEFSIIAIKFGLSVSALIIAIIPIGAAITWMVTKLFYPRHSKLDWQSDRDKDWVEFHSKNYIEWIIRQHESNTQYLISIIVTCIVPFSCFVFTYPLWKLNSFIYLNQDKSPIVNSNDQYLIIFAFFPIALFLMPVLGSLHGLIPGFRRAYLSMAKKGTETQPATTAYTTARLLSKALETGQLTNEADPSPEELHDLQLRMSLHYSARHFKWVLPAFALVVLVDTFWYRAWYEDHVRISPVWTWQTQDYSYADAEQVEISCKTYREDGDDRAQLRYTLTFPNNVQLRLNSNDVRRDLPAVAQVHEGVLRSGAPIVRTFETEAGDCRTVLADHWGRERGEAAWSLLFEGHVADG